MKTILATAVVALALLGATPAFAQEAAPSPPADAVEEYTPPAPPVYSQTGEWIDTDAYGQIWVPTSTTTVVVRERPYAYFYTPTYGWTWYVSPWGPGIYRRGPWIHTAVAPHVYYHNAWVVHPHARYTYRPAVVYHPVVRSAPPAHVAPARHVQVVHPHHRR